MCRNTAGKSGYFLDRSCAAPSRGLEIMRNESAGVTGDGRAVLADDDAVRRSGDDPAADHRIVAIDARQLRPLLPDVAFAAVRTVGGQARCYDVRALAAEQWLADFGPPGPPRLAGPPRQ